MEKKELVCIGCPMGCVMQVEMEGEEVISVTGNTCTKGERYSRKEVTDPTRIVTTTVKVKNGVDAGVPVKTREDIPKGKIFGCIRALKGVEIEAPVRIGDVILENAAGTGVDVIATKDVDAQH